MILALQSLGFALDSQKVLENDRVRVVRAELPSGGELPTDNTLDALTIQLSAGRVYLLEPGQLAKDENSGRGQVRYFVAGSRRSLKNIGKQTVTFVQVQLLRPSGKYVPFEMPAFHYCNPGSQKSCVKEQYLFCTDRFCAETVTLDPGAASTQHTHDADYMVIATSAFTWRNEPVGKPPMDEKFSPGDVQYIEAGGSHRLVNTGSTTAKLFVIQFK
jgi:quercetin dioxygenase-like cupin family protein